MLCYAPSLCLLKLRTALVIVNVFLCRTGGETILYRANMVRTVSVRVSEDLYSRINKLLEHTCFNLSWLIRLYLVHLTAFYETIENVEEFVQATEDVARANNFFDSNNLM